MNKVFSESPEIFWSKNATVGGSFTNDYSYSIGYWKAGDILVDNALLLGKNERDSLFYPICFTYRHFIEITLKQLIIYSELFYEKTESIGYELDKYIKSEEKLDSIHNLEKLLSRLIKVLKCFSDESFDGEMKSIILDFHSIDPSGQIFRYSITTKKEKSFPKIKNFNIDTIKNEINKIAVYFMGIDGFIDYYNEIANDIIGSYHYD